MIYFKEIFLPNFKNIQKKIDSYFSEWVTLPTGGVTLIDKEKIKQVAPELEDDLLSMNIKIQNIGVHVLYKDTESKVHVDYVNPNQNQCRLNIPIRNTEGSKTAFYTGGNYKKIYQNFKPVCFYLQAIDDSAVKVSEIEMINPTIIRVQEPHKVIINLQKVPRICLTIYTDVDMVSFLEDN